MTASESEFTMATATPSTTNLSGPDETRRSIRPRWAADFSGLSVWKIAITPMPTKITPSRASTHAAMSAPSVNSPDASIRERIRIPTPASINNAPHTKMRALRIFRLACPRINADTTAAAGAAAAAASP